MPVLVQNCTDHDITVPSKKIIAELSVPLSLSNPTQTVTKDSSLAVPCTGVCSNTKGSITFDFGESPLPKEWKARITQNVKITSVLTEMTDTQSVGAETDLTVPDALIKSQGEEDEVVADVSKEPDTSEAEGIPQSNDELTGTRSFHAKKIY
ncbi:hypothetical protein DPX16_10819 [Anabarilius grahami]|uniref:Uncharacterized protein n=1 Tax=Anabarilius grahami TaxID=495550 RepID=A0A3N0Z7F8_ANAGA|nr:hypothetical protein DPX16_10819 [Anabarilius grahami]